MIILAEEWLNKDWSMKIELKLRSSKFEEKVKEGAGIAFTPLGLDKEKC